MRPIWVGQDATMSRICAASASLRSLGKLNSTMCCKVTAVPSSWWPARSVELEVLPHFPVADVLSIRQRILGDGRLVAGYFRSLHLQQVNDHGVAERLAEEAVLLQRADRVSQRGRQGSVLARVRIGLNGRRRLELPPDAIESGGDVGGHVQVRGGGRLAPPHFHPAV